MKNRAVRWSVNKDPNCWPDDEVEIHVSDHAWLRYRQRVECHDVGREEFRRIVREALYRNERSMARGGRWVFYHEDGWKIVIDCVDAPVYTVATVLHREGEQRSFYTPGSAGILTNETIRYVARCVFQDNRPEPWEHVTQPIRGDFIILVRSVLEHLLETPTWVPWAKNEGAGDADWLDRLAGAFERRAERRMDLVMRPQQVLDICGGLRKAAAAARQDDDDAEGET